MQVTASAGRPETRSTHGISRPKRPREADEKTGTIAAILADDPEEIPVPKIRVSRSLSRRDSKTKTDVERSFRSWN